MPKKKSNEIFADFYEDVASGKRRMVDAFNVHKDTAQAWSRPKPSVTNPTASGKGNPIDQAERALRIIHPHDPARAREIPDYLEAICDELDRDDGIAEADETENPCAAIARVIKKSSRLVMENLHDCRNPEKVKTALRKTNDLLAEVTKLKECLKRILESEEK